jgi:hypothetical protein
MTHLTQHNILGGMNPQQYCYEYLMSYLTVLLVKSSSGELNLLQYHSAIFNGISDSAVCHATTMLSVKTLPPQA